MKPIALFQNLFPGMRREEMKNIAFRQNWGKETKTFKEYKTSLCFRRVEDSTKQF